ncbi:MAG TPA: hypothetical protein VJC18_05115, partial [bacterium]|nr:hypothetical protein [bacterium]
MNFILFLAKRYLSRTGVQGLRSWLIIVSTVGIFLASFMVLVALGVLAGYQRVYHKAVLGFSAHLIIFNSEGLTDGDQQEITGFLKQSKMANVFSPYHFYETIAPSEDGPKPIIFKGVDETKMRQMYPIEFEDLPAGSSNNVFVGKDVLVRQPEPTSQGQLNYLTNPHLGSERKTTLKSMPLQGIF